MLGSGIVTYDSFPRHFVYNVLFSHRVRTRSQCIRVAYLIELWKHRFMMIRTHLFVSLTHGHPTGRPALESESTGTYQTHG